MALLAPKQAPHLVYRLLLLTWQYMGANVGSCSYL